MTQLYIRGFDEEKYDLISVSKKYGTMPFDPFVGCCWEYKNADALIGQWIEIENEWVHEQTGAILVTDTSCNIKIITQSEVKE